jgi:hypothetical protein
METCNSIIESCQEAGVSPFAVIQDGRVRPIDCYEEDPRLCRRTACRYHLEAATETCAIDVAERGPQTLRAVAKLLGISNVAVLQIQRRALAKLKTG